MNLGAIGQVVGSGLIGFATGGPVGAIAGAASAYGAYDQNRRAAGAANDLRAYQQRFAENAHRIEMADLKAAGLNPILTATGGSGAHIPGGAMAQTTPIGSESAARGLEQKLGQALFEKQSWEAVAAREAATKSRREADVAVETARNLKEARPGITYDSISKGVAVSTAASEQQIRNAQAEMARLELAIARAAQAGKTDEAKMLGEEWYKWKRRLDAGMESVNSAMSAVGKVVAPVAAMKGAKAVKDVGARIGKIQRPPNIIIRNIH